MIINNFFCLFSCCRFFFFLFFSFFLSNSLKTARCFLVTFCRQDAGQKTNTCRYFPERISKGIIPTCDLCQLLVNVSFKWFRFPERISNEIPFHWKHVIKMLTDDFLASYGKLNIKCCQILIFCNLISTRLQLLQQPFQG